MCGIMSLALPKRRSGHAVLHGRYGLSRPNPPSKDAHLMAGALQGAPLAALDAHKSCTAADSSWAIRGDWQATVRREETPQGDQQGGCL